MHKFELFPRGRLVFIYLIDHLIWNTETTHLKLYSPNVCLARRCRHSGSDIIYTDRVIPLAFQSVVSLILLVYVDERFLNFFGAVYTFVVYLLPL